jgi:CBS domain-containing protein
MRIDSLNHLTVSRLAVIAAGATLRSAAIALSSSHIGLVIVCDESGAIAGVVSKSDLVRHLALGGAAEAPVTTQMSGDIVSCTPADDIHATWKIMAARNLQNVPVLSADSKPLGVLDIRDALKALYEQEEYQERLLSNYVAGVGYQ